MIVSIYQITKFYLIISKLDIVLYHMVSTGWAKLSDTTLHFCL